MVPQKNQTNIKWDFLKQTWIDAPNWYIDVQSDIAAELSLCSTKEDAEAFVEMHNGDFEIV